MLAQFPTRGFSDEARRIEKVSKEQNRNLRTSAALGRQELLDELGAVWEECKHPNWDGYQAHPVLQDTLRNAYCLLESL